MRLTLRTTAASATALLALAGIAARPASAAAEAPSTTPTVVHVGQIAHEDIPPRLGSEPQTLVEPSVAVSPVDSNVAVAAAHDGRYASGGAVDISRAWTNDGGRTWSHGPMQGLTKAAGGVWDRASDPVVAFGPNGDAYISVLVFDTASCASGVAVARSTDGGATFGTPVLAHSSTSCNYSDDKNWLVIDTQNASPHVGRLYQFWTAYIGRNGGGTQVLRWSDDRGQHWSATTMVSGPRQSTQDSQPMIQPDGTITDAYNLFLSKTAPIVARTSTDGGATWSAAVVVNPNSGGNPANVRCCLPSGTADHATGHLYMVWEANTLQDAVMLSTSRDGRHWTAARQVSHGGATSQVINSAVTAYGGRVFISYGIRDLAVSNGRYVQQQVTSSYDGGVTFGAPLGLGPLSDLKYAAFAGGRFPGDYIGASATATTVVLVWCVSSQPASPTAKYDQTLYGAVLRP